MIFTKMTFFLMYLQMFWPFKWLRVGIYLGATVTTTFYLVVEIFWLYYTIPRKGQSFLSVAASPAAKSKELLLSVPVAAVGLGIDVYLLILPITAAMQLQLPTRRKVGVVLIFLTGIAYGKTTSLSTVMSLTTLIELACPRHSVSTTEPFSTGMPISPGISCLSMFSGILSLDP